MAARTWAHLKKEGPVQTARAARNQYRGRQVLTDMQRQGQRIEWGEGIHLEARLVIRGPGLVIIGDRCRFRGALPTIIETVSAEAVVRLGAGCSLLGTAITAAVGVEVGAGSLLGQASLIDTDFHSVQRNRRDPSVRALAAPIHLGDNVWVATGAHLLKGVTVGDHAVIGAHAIVRQPVPADAIVIGNPQQIVGYLDPDVEPYWP